MDKLLTKYAERFLFFIFFLFAAVLPSHLLEKLGLLLVGLDLDKIGHRDDRITGPSRLTVDILILLVILWENFFLWTINRLLKVFALFL
jgi:hypothetical protein